MDTANTANTANTVDTTVDQYSIDELRDRYQLGRTALYNRFKALDIRPTKRKNRAYVSGEQVEQLDRLDVHLKRGESLESFVQSVHQTFGEKGEQDGELRGGPMGNAVEAPGFAPDAMQPPPWYLMTVESVVEGLVRRLASVVQVQAVPTSRQPGMRLSHLRELEEAYEKGWLLSTSELADLLGLSVQTVRGYGEQFEEAGFVFRRSGKRARGELAWSVDKLRRGAALPPQIEPASM